MTESHNTSSTEYKAEIIAKHLKEKLGALRDGTGRSARPLMVSMQGPQGAGKSTLAAGLVSLLANWGLRCAVASLDDFYLDYRGLKSLAQEYPDNEMLQGRGPPGTHDIPLLKSVLGSVTKINDSTPSSVDLPSFDKSQHSGFGDRSPTPIPLKGPIDIFILEGWSLGFEPRDSETLKQLHEQGRTAKKHSFSTIDQINQNLITFAGEINNRFDTHISIFPKSYGYVYKWRLQQEDHMKSGNGGKGMTDEEVEKFVDRYMPAYELYKGTDGRCGGLRLVFGEEREVLSVEELSRH